MITKKQKTMDYIYAGNTGGAGEPTQPLEMNYQHFSVLSAYFHEMHNLVCVYNITEMPFSVLYIQPVCSD